MDAKTETAREIPLKLILTGLLFFTAVFLFAYIAKVVVLGKKDLFDSNVFAYLKSHTTPSVIEWMKGITFFGSELFLLPAYIVVVALLFFVKQKRLALDIAIIGISSDLLKLLLKNSFQRQRPDLPLLESLHSYSFPSGHALSSFIFFSMLIYVLWKEKLHPAWKWMLSVALLLFSFLIGISRIVLRYHYASDVIAGFCFGFSWVLLSLWLLNKLHFWFRSNRSNP